MEYADIIKFHGHSCPGLAIGFRLATAAMNALGATRSDDEELVAVVESDACGVDALQCVSGCTFGKGNLVFRDYGKHAYSLFSRVKQQGVRVVFHGKGIPAELREDKPAFARRIMTEQEDAIVICCTDTIRRTADGPGQEVRHLLLVAVNLSWIPGYVKQAMVTSAYPVQNVQAPC